jgi:alcohol dehydrogenase (cytochrome c)
MRGLVRLAVPSVLLILALSLVGPAAGEKAPAGTPLPHGQASYQTHCAPCHGAALGGGFGPPLIGVRFAGKWAERGVPGLLAYIVANMPPGHAGQLDPAEYAIITDWVASANGMSAGTPPGATPTRSTPPRNALGRIVRAATPNEDMTARAAIARQTGLLAHMRPVDGAMLRTPPPADWLHWRRTYDAHGFSPLKQIDRGNVRRLVPAWTLSLANGANQITPLVHDGVMFVASGNEVIAIDATSGDIVWRYVRASSPGAGTRNQPRSIAISDNRLFVPTIDAHMLALDTRTGALLWDHQVAPATSGLQFVSGPLVVEGKVIQGAAGCATDSIPGGCFLVALDASSGNELWRLNTIARPGEPGGDSWNGAPLDQRFGGAIWSTASYDPDTGLIYVGTAQTYRTATLRRPATPPGPSNAALHTDSTLAVDPDTGRLVWSYQHLQRDIWDFDWGFEQTLVHVGGHDLVVTVGKLGIVDALDAKTGAYMFSHDLGLQKVVTRIDPATGRKTVASGLEGAADGSGVNICPSSFGVRNWPATSYDTATHLLYLPMFDACMDFFWNPGTAWDISWQIKPPPASDGRFGRIEAIDLATGKAVWTQRTRAPQSSAMLSTAGGLVFSGARDRWFRAQDDRTGATLWQVRLSAAPNAFPVSFGVDGVQYVAIVAGGGGPLDAGFRSFTPELEDATGGPTLFVFRLLVGP